MCGHTTYPESVAKPNASKQEPERAPEMVARPSPETVLLFLKHAALEPGWTPTDVAETLGVDAATAKQIVDELT
jgi:hypothetical protein